MNDLKMSSVAGKELRNQNFLSVWFLWDPLKCQIWHILICLLACEGIFMNRIEQNVLQKTFFNFSLFFPFCSGTCESEYKGSHLELRNQWCFAWVMVGFCRRVKYRRLTLTSSSLKLIDGGEGSARGSPDLQEICGVRSWMITGHRIRGCAAVLYGQH